MATTLAPAGTSAITLPTVHLNGSSARDLAGQQRAVMRAAAALREALAQASPNARDFYVQSPDAYPRAAEEHRAVLAQVAAIEARAEAIAMHVLDRD